MGYPARCGKAEHDRPPNAAAKKKSRHFKDKGNQITGREANDSDINKQGRERENKGWGGTILRHAQTEFCVFISRRTCSAFTAVTCHEDTVRCRTGSGRGNKWPRGNLTREQMRYWESVLVRLTVAFREHLPREDRTFPTDRRLRSLHR